MVKVAILQCKDEQLLKGFFTVAATYGLNSCILTISFLQFSVPIGHLSGQNMKGGLAGAQTSPT